jgi:hypothetical protein
LLSLPLILAELIARKDKEGKATKMQGHLALLSFTSAITCICYKS